MLLGAICGVGGVCLIAIGVGMTDTPVAGIAIAIVGLIGLVLCIMSDKQ